MVARSALSSANGMPEWMGITKLLSLLHKVSFKQLSKWLLTRVSLLVLTESTGSLPRKMRFRYPVYILRVAKCQVNIRYGVP